MLQEIILAPEIAFLVAGFLLMLFSRLIALNFYGILEIRFIEENDYFIKKTSFYSGLACIALAVFLILGASTSIPSTSGQDNGGTDIPNGNGVIENGDSGESEPEPRIESSTSIVGWEYFEESGSQVQNFSQDSQGFSFLAASVGTVDPQKPQYIGIQTISISPVNLSSGDSYRLQFSIKSTQDFVLVVRIGQKAPPYTSVLNEGKVFISGDGNYEEKEIEFQVENTSDAFLHFQFGNASSGSEIGIRDINLIKLAS